MSAKPKDEAFQRHPRPQLPTKATLLVESRKIQKKVKLSSPHEHIKAPTLHHGTPWESMNRLGDMIQGNRRWHVSQFKGKLTMLRKMDLNPGRKYLEKVKLLAHQNIAKLEDLFEDDSSLYFRFEYSRFTLEEVLNVHIHLKEPHILVIACSIFFAIKHIATAGIIHNAISPATIRICGNSGRVLLSDFDDCIFQTTNLSSNIDLELLGFTLLECMEGTPSKHLRDSKHVRRQRELNKIFGLKDGGSWSGFKLLVDFLDDLFNDIRPAITKLDRPHRYVNQHQPDHSILVPFLELVPLECFTLWRPAARKADGGEVQ